MSTNAPSTAEQETPLDPDEPHTPMWFTFLGVGLFLLGGIFLLISAGDEEDATATAAPDTAADAPTNAGEGDAAAAAEAADPHAGHAHD